MIDRRAAFKALIDTKMDEGMTRTGLAVPGEAATFIVMLSAARARESSGEAERDSRLR